MPKTVYFFPLDTDLKEGKAIPITLAPDGSADLSLLPQKIIDNFKTFGVLDALHQNNVLPEQGEKFLNALLDTSDAYWRFRETPNPLVL